MGSPTIPSKSSPATREKLAPSTQDVLVPRKDADPDKQTRIHYFRLADQSPAITRSALSIAPTTTLM
jgi:hypothetical protein